MAVWKAAALTLGPMVKSIEGNGKMIKCMAEVSFIGPMEPAT